MGCALAACVNAVSAREREARVVVARAQASGRRLAQRERNWLVPLGRSGYAANGLASALALLTGGAAQPGEDQVTQDRSERARTRGA